MNNCKIMMGVVALTAACAVQGSAQISYNNGDLLAGFRNGGPNDLIVDLGPISNFQQSNIPQITYSLGSALTTAFGGTAGVYWSVFGVNDTTISPSNSSVTQADPNTLWTTLARSNPSVQTAAPFVFGNSSVQQLPLEDIETIASSTVSGSGSPITPLGNGIDEINNTTGFGYTPSIGNGTLNGDLRYDIENVGTGVSDLYQSDPGSRYSTKATYIGNFVLDPSGNLTFNSVPEPSTWAMMGSGVMALVALGRFRNRK